MQQQQRIHFTNTADGVNIAYCTRGEGPALMLLGGWVSHLEMDLENPSSLAFVEKLSDGGQRRLIRLDMRGSGLSDRQVDDLSIHARARDVEAVVDAVGADKLAIFAQSMNGPTAIIYAATHPEKVSHLILFGSFSHQSHGDREPLGKALVDLIRAEWRIGAKAIGEFVHPNADKDISEALSRYQLASSSGDVAASILDEALFHTDVREYLPKLTMPTLVLHRRDDKAFPAGCGRDLAALLPHAHFVSLAGDAHLPFYGDTDSVIEAVNDFLATSDGHAHQEHSARRAPVPRVAPGLQIILFTDMEGSTSLTQLVGDARAQEMVRTHNSIVREALALRGGSEIKHTGDGLMASIPSASGGIDCALDIQGALAEHNEANPELPINVRVGLNAGEPVVEEEDLFGTAVQLASRIAGMAQPGQILVSDVVRQLAAGKGYLFSDVGETPLRGFEDPVRLFEVRS
ncbi:MAG: adenylate/guanylate cyclase domain-containing protein [Dehalococcoidia bacterium]